ncbi:hypothetical protein R1sor_014364 [Riccia sorocarpa]|uniref:Uncharacterized protein n=1 Tax=Riccia sorocarpa TaxID=122646 RepID=A0ABD3HD06_9MARC
MGEDHVHGTVEVAAKSFLPQEVSTTLPSGLVVDTVLAQEVHQPETELLTGTVAVSTEDTLKVSTDLVNPAVLTDLVNPATLNVEVPSSSSHQTADESAETGTGKKADEYSHFDNSTGLSSEECEDPRPEPHCAILVQEKKKSRKGAREKKSKK